MIAKICNLKQANLLHFRIYILKTTKEQAELQLSREPRKSLKMMTQGNQKEITDFQFEYFNHRLHPTLH